MLSFWCFSDHLFFLRLNLFSSVFGCFLQTFRCFSLSLQLVCVLGCFLSSLSTRRDSLPSLPFLYVLLVLPLWAGLSSHTTPFHSSAALVWPAARFSTVSPARLFPSGRAVFPPSLLPPPSSSPVSLSCVTQCKTLNEKNFEKRSSTNFSYASVCALFCLPISESRDLALSL